MHKVASLIKLYYWNRGSSQVLLIMSPSHIFVAKGEFKKVEPFMHFTSKTTKKIRQFQKAELVVFNKIKFRNYAYHYKNLKQYLKIHSSFIFSGKSNNYARSYHQFPLIWHAHLNERDLYIMNPHSFLGHLMLVEFRGPRRTSCSPLLMSGTDSSWKNTY